MWNRRKLIENVTQLLHIYRYWQLKGLSSPIIADTNHMHSVFQLDLV